MNRLIPLLILGLLASAVPTAHATSFREISFADLVEKTEAVVQVKVVSTTSEWTAIPDLRTTAELEVVRSLHGPLTAGQTFDVVEVGGTVDDYTVEAVGFPKFREGDNLVVFLSRWTDGSNDWRVHMYGQGFYEVVKDAAGRDALIAGAVQGEERNGPRVVLTRVVPALMRIDDLVETIQNLR